ncbi:hypothetical protein BZG12_09815 [Salinivibrio kushneri]|nr:hypothetical protein BZG12_09815 [Salinivibrio kushneri]
MCTRIFNNLNPQYPITARNMDWFWPINTYFYRFPKGMKSRGLDAGPMWLIIVSTFITLPTP